MLEQRIQQQFFESADLKYQAAEVLARPVAEAAAALISGITSGGKVLVAGSGVCAPQASQFAAALLGQFERERPGLAALALGSDGGLQAALSRGGDASEVVSKQLHALGQPGDALVLLTTRGDALDACAAVEAAHAKDMTVVVLTGRDGGRVTAKLNDTDVHIAVPHDRAARIQEVHQLVLHCLCDAVDLQLLGEQESA